MIEIVSYEPIYKPFIKTLNYEWLQKYFDIEANDIVQLSNPEEEILNKGGKIYFALHNNEVVGTSTLMKMDVEEYELAKMAVTEKSQGLGIGEILLEHCIQKAKDMHIKRLSLFSNTKLTAAIALYKKYGFLETPLPLDVHYKRANIKMIKYLG